MTPRQAADDAERCAFDQRDRPGFARAMGWLVVDADLTRLSPSQLKVRRDQMLQQVRDINDRLIAAGEAGLRTRSLQRLLSMPAPDSLDPSE